MLRQESHASRTGTSISVRNLPWEARQGAAHAHMSNPIMISTPRDAHTYLGCVSEESLRDRMRKAPARAIWRQVDHWRTFHVLQDEHDVRLARIVCPT